uniref:DUF4485 domain-containing protein n=1 Tax=Panagrellus redivivus TaxID=6233 RepID=A0A7E4ZTX4_PANRE
MTTPTCRPLPRLSLRDLTEIDEFIERNKNAITPAEVNRINELIRDYHRDRTMESRRKIKTFLLYLRRSILPSPHPPARQVVANTKIKKTDSQLSNTTTDISDDDTQVTPLRRHPIKERLHHWKDCGKQRGRSLPRMGVTICQRPAPKATLFEI